jgi:HK97 family phage major capsid protein
MPDIEYRLTDEQMLAEIGRQTRETLSSLEHRMDSELRAIKARISRPPGAPEIDAAQLFDRRPSAGLAQNTAFENFLRSTRSRHSHFNVELPFALKAVVPISGVGLPQPIMPIFGAPQIPLRLAQLMFTVPISSGAVVFTEETSFTPGAALVPETTLKPPTGITFAPKTLTVETIATIAKCSVQSLQDTPTLGTWIDARLAYAVLLKQEQYLLNDAATGLLTLATAQAAPPVGATTLDAVALAIGQLTALGFVPDGIVMNSADITTTRITKTTQGQYIWASPDSDVGTSAMWNLPLIAAPSMPAGQFLVGAFGQSTILFDRQILMVEISYENEDDFIHNLACFRGELRCVAGVPLPAGLVKGVVPAPGVVAASAPAAAPHEHPKK